MSNTRLSVFIATYFFAALAMSVGVLSALPAYAQQSVSIKGPKAATDQFSGNVYGPITSDDTLWRIADRYRQNRALSIYQVMLAIYELNPEAFEKQNLNLMIDGAILRLPSERYVSRIDIEEARQRALQDEQSWAKAQTLPGDPVENVKPPSPPVNQDDLNVTKTALENRLDSLNRSQIQQFDALKQQFSQSITSVEALLEDNQKLYERIEQVDSDLDALRERVEGDVKTTMDAQSQNIDEMLTLLRQEQAQREQESESSILTSLNSPMVIIIVSSLFTLSLIGGLAYWLLTRKSKPKAEVPVDKPEKPISKAPDAADLPVDDGLLDEPLNEDEVDDDDLFNDDDLLDDVLSSELEDSLDEELENFSDLSDEMLVPETETETAEDASVDDLFEEGDSKLAQDDLDSLFDESDDDGIELSADDDVEQIDQALSEDSESPIDDTLLDEALEDGIDDDEIADIAESAASTTDTTIEDELGEIESDSLFEEPTDTETDVTEPNSEADDPEISIDELLEENAEEPSIEEKLGVDGDNLDEDMLSKLDNEIEQQNQELDNLTDNLIDEIQQLEMMDGMLDLDDDEILIENPEADADGLQDLDALAEDLEEIEIEDMENAEEFSEALPDNLIDELQKTESIEDLDDVEDISSTLDDDLTDELLEELDAESDQALSETDTNNDDLADELLQELESEQTPESDADSLADELLAELGVDDDTAPSNEEELAIDETDVLADELLDELESSVSEEDAISEDIDSMADELLEELSTDIEETPSSEALDNTSDEPESDLTQGSNENETDGDNESNKDHTDELPEESNDALNEELSELDSFELSDLADTPQDHDDDISLSTSENSDQIEAEDEQIADQFEELGQTDAPERIEDLEELEDVPGLGDWLSEDAQNTDTSILDELENTDFDELLSSIDDDPQNIDIDDIDVSVAEAGDKSEQLSGEDSAEETHTENGTFEDAVAKDAFTEGAVTEDRHVDQDPSATEEPVKTEVSQQLDNPDLDLDALFSEPEGEAEDLISVDKLLEDADIADETQADQPFELDVSLGDFTAETKDEDVIDVDTDSGQAANLDLARAYIDMEDGESAKDLLDEVLLKGTDDQKQEAQTLIDELSRDE